MYRSADAEPEKLVAMIVGMLLVDEKEDDAEGMESVRCEEKEWLCLSIHTR